MDHLPNLMTNIGPPRLRKPGQFASAPELSDPSLDPLLQGGGSKLYQRRKLIEAEFKRDFLLPEETYGRDLRGGAPLRPGDGRPPPQMQSVRPPAMPREELHERLRRPSGNLIGSPATRDPDVPTPSQPSSWRQRPRRPSSETPYSEEVRANLRRPRMPSADDDDVVGENPEPQPRRSSRRQTHREMERMKEEASERQKAEEEAWEEKMRREFAENAKNNRRGENGNNHAPAGGRGRKNSIPFENAYQATAQAEAEAEAEAEAASKKDAHARRRQAARAQYEAQVQSEAEKEAYAKAQIEEQAQAQAKSRAEADAKTYAHAKAQADAKAEAAAAAELRAASKNEDKSEGRVSEGRAWVREQAERLRRFMKRPQSQSDNRASSDRGESEEGGAPEPEEQEPPQSQRRRRRAASEPQRTHDEPRGREDSPPEPPRSQRDASAEPPRRPRRRQPETEEKMPQEAEDSPPEPSFRSRTRRRQPETKEKMPQSSCPELSPKSAKYMRRTLQKSAGEATLRRGAMKLAEANAMQQLNALQQMSTKEERIKGFKELLREWHPDKNPENQEVATFVFQRLQQERIRVIGK